jgi:hypothetical protein
MPVFPVAFIPLGERAILSRASFRKPVALTVLAIGESRPIVLALALALIRRPLGIGLRGIRRHVRLRLKPLLRLRISALPLSRRGETIGHGVEIAVVFEVIAFSWRSRLTALCERLGSLSGCNKSKVMLGVLQIILRRDRISARMRVSGEL